jgi:large subunit ribosomal protein L25
MAEQTSTPLSARRREPSGSRSARRLRHTGEIPGIVYGGEDAPVAFSVNARDLRHALMDTGALLDLQLDGGAGQPVVLKEQVRHPVTGETTHIDLLRVRLDVAIQSQVAVELIGVDDAPGVKLGGVLEQPLREVTVEALPTDIPDVIQADVSALKVGETLTFAALIAPAGVTIIGQPDTLVAAISASRMSRGVGGDAEIETETELVGEAEAAAEAESEAQDADAGDDAGDAAE